jgi:hypothetical protein
MPCVSSTVQVVRAVQSFKPPSLSSPSAEEENSERRFEPSARVERLERFEPTLCGIPHCPHEFVGSTAESGLNCVVGIEGGIFFAAPRSVNRFDRVKLPLDRRGTN